MQRSFILPTHLGTQQQGKRKRLQSGAKTSAALPKLDAPNTHRLPPPASALRTPLPTVAGSVAENNGNHGANQKRPLKRKLSEDRQYGEHAFAYESESSALQSRDAQQPNITSQPLSHPSTASGPFSVVNFSTSNSTNTLQSTTMPPPSTGQNARSVGSALSLADRKKTLASQVIKRLIVVPGHSTQRSRHPSSRPSPNDTVPSHLKAIRNSDPTKIRKSSDFARSIVLPPVNISATSSRRKKKGKFMPPLVSGGYAERLANLMSYQKSEYTMWANATLREVKLFGSTDPLAVVEVKHIARDHHLQWTWCSVIFSDKNKPPFDVEPRMNQHSNNNNHDLSLPASPLVELNVPGSMEIVVVGSTASQDFAESTQDNEASSWAGDDDSISGLHTEMNKMDVVCSSQGSIFEGSIGDNMKSQRRWLAQDGPILNAINEDDEEIAPADLLLFLRSSQGSEDEVDDYHQSFIRCGEASKLRPPGLETSRPFELSCVNGWTQGEDSVSSDEIEESEATIPKGDDGVRPAASAVVIIDDHSSDSGGVQAVISTPFEKADNVASSARARSEAGPCFAIIFSNLFNWSTLKVTDKVEIHEPCLKITVPQLGSSSHDSAVWVVERYKVLAT